MWSVEGICGGGGGCRANNLDDYFKMLSRYIGVANIRGIITRYQS